MQKKYSKFMSLWLSQPEWVKALLIAVVGAIFGYFAEIYNDAVTDWTHFDFLQAAVDAFKDWRAIVNKIIFAVLTYIGTTLPRNSLGQYFKSEPKE